MLSYYVMIFFYPKRIFRNLNTVKQLYILHDLYNFHKQLQDEITEEEEIKKLYHKEFFNIKILKQRKI